MAAIDWCLKQSKGIRLIEPNDNLFEEYIQTAEETLDVLRSIEHKSKIWLATTKYYCEYFAIYALLMKLGIKCEIHECTISLCKLLEENKVIPKDYTGKLREDKQLRIDNQYYLKNKEVKIDYPEIVDFVYTLKNIGAKITAEEIERVRKIIISNSQK